MSVFDALKSYKTEWEEVKSRPFSDEEKGCFKSVVVKASKWGKSAEFLMLDDKKKYIPLDSTCVEEVGVTLNVGDLILVDLVYKGSDPARQGNHILRIKVERHEEPASFDNPFGL